MYNDLWLIDKYKTKTKSSDLYTKVIDVYTKKDAIIALEHLNKNYWNYWEASNFSKGLNYVSWDNSIDELESKHEVNIFQEDLIYKILWNRKWYNNEYILAFTKEKGNHLIKISDFENKINSKEKIGWEVTANYISYLNEKHPNKKEFLENARQIFWKRFNKLWPLLKKWENDRMDNGYKILEKYTIIKKWILNLDYFNWVYENFENIFKSTNKFLDYFSSPWQKIDENLINFMKENNDIAKNHLRNNLLIKFNNIENKEQVVDEMINEIFEKINNWNLSNVYQIIKKYEKNHNLNLDEQQITHNSYKIATAETKIEMFTTVKKWDKKTTLKLRSNIIWFEKTITLNKYITENERNELIIRTQAWEAFENIISDFRQKNKNLDQALANNEEENKEPKITSNYQPAFEENDFKEKGWQIIVTTHDEKEIPITIEEKKLIIWNEKLTEKLIDFYTTLNKIWLWKLWKYRKNISHSIWSKTNYDNELLWKKEIQNFINSILKSIWKQEIEANNWLDQFVSSYKNQYLLYWSKNNTNIIWDSTIEEIFFINFIKEWKFQSDIFKKEIQKKN